MKIEFSKIVDLTHEISNDMPIWNGDPKTDISTIPFERYIVEKLQIGTHSGTHVGTSKHFGLSMKISDLDESALLTKAVMLDVSKRDITALEEKDVKEWEGKNKLIEEECVILKTDQDKFWHNATRYFSDYPGFGVSAIEYLLKRNVRIFATDAPGIDPSNDKNFLSNKKIFEKNCIHIENLTNLGKLPSYNFWIFIGALKMKTGGSPARIVALV